MGLFDYVRSSYNLGEQFTDVSLQTKDIEIGMSGTMTHYWLDPIGRLWCPSYIGCHTLEIYDEGHPKYNPNTKFVNFEWIPTGKRGKYRPHRITKSVTVYPSKWDRELETWPECIIFFKDGVLCDYIHK